MKLASTKKARLVKAKFRTDRPAIELNFRLFPGPLLRIVYN
jgi:hypothetical protein